MESMTVYQNNLSDPGTFTGILSKINVDKNTKSTSESTLHYNYLQVDMQGLELDESQENQNCEGEEVQLKFQIEYAKYKVHHQNW
eukprot:Pgem_evm1s8588